MPDKPGGYGRYGDDPEHVGCPRARTDMTPCAARDGSSAITHTYGNCVGCGQHPADLLTALVREVTQPRPTGYPPTITPEPEGVGGLIDG
jgi:hypothetical protein